MTMIDHNDDDDSSVESEFMCERGDDSSVPCIDDISVSPYRDCGLPKNGSVESLFSQVSIEIDLAPLTSRDKGRHHGMVSSVPDAFVQVSDEPSGLRRDDSLSGSCNSIKEQLHFGAINEHEDYDSLASSDVESSSDEESSDEEEEKPSPKTKPKKKYTRPVFKNYGSGDESSDAESSVDNNIINTILRKTDSREQMRGSKRTVRTTKYTQKGKKQPGKVKDKDVTSDALLNRFFVQRRDQPGGEATKPAKSQRPTRQKRVPATKHNDVKLDSIMNKTDSLNHVNQIGHRVVKTIKDVRHKKDKKTSRRSSLGCTDDLMERFLSSKGEKSVSSPRRSSTPGYTNPAKEEISNKTFTSIDSMNRVQGKGQRVVKTRMQLP
jgi:hypothetical protein